MPAREITRWTMPPGKDLHESRETDNGCCLIEMTIVCQLSRFSEKAEALTKHVESVYKRFYIDPKKNDRETCIGDRAM